MSLDTERRLIQYKIINGRNTDNLSRNVNEQIKRGWKPQGGVSIVGMNYNQAMVKERD